MNDIEAELDCARRGALIKPTTFGTIVVSGKDRLIWLNGLVTCDLAPKKPGDAAYGLAVGKTGKIIDEVYVLVGKEELWVGVRSEHAAELVSSLDRYLVMEDAEIAVAEGYQWLLAMGPRAADALTAARALGAHGGLVERGGLPTALVCVTLAGASAVESAIEACAPARVASADGWQRLRVEHGIAEYGVDFDRENYPQEPALEKDGVSFQKGCYLGQEAVFMLEKRGHVKKRLVQLVVDGPTAVGDTIATRDGVEIGKVTTAIATENGSLALGYVKYKHATADNALLAANSPAKVTGLLAIKLDE